MPHLLHTLRDELPISHLFLTIYAENARDNPEASAVESVRLAYAETFCEDLTDEQVLMVCKRLETHGERLKVEAEKRGAGPEERKAVKAERGFGDYFREWLSGLDMTEMLLWLTDYNTAEAKRLYRFEDYELVEKMVATKKLHQAEAARLQYEASLFGFGGKYGRSSGPGGRRDEGEVRVHDLSGVTAQQALDRLAALGRRG